MKRLVIASNRLPIVLSREGGAWRIFPGAGGLLTALTPVLKQRGGLWIGWPGTSSSQGLGSALSRESSLAGYTLKPVMLTPTEVHRFYVGFSNQIVWPLFHDLQTSCNFDPSFWTTYQEVNRKFARVIKRNLRRGDYLWVHDYHLMNVAQELRGAGVRVPIGFFLHIPFPPLDMFLKLPWRSEIIKGLLNFDLLGFQTQRDMGNFLDCIKNLAEDMTIEGRGQVVTLRIGRRRIRVGRFPISIDVDEFDGAAQKPEVAKEAAKIRSYLSKRKIMLGVDRLDYTKGIPERLRAFRNALSRFPELRRRISLIQIVVPSRENIQIYQELKNEIELLVSEINGRYSRPGWMPVHYLFRSLTRDELMAYYRCADIGLVTPVKDGMNLVAKEFCIAQVDNDAVLILSEFAGSASQLKDGALLINPYDVEGTSLAIQKAFSMRPKERKSRMLKLRQDIRKQDIYRWVDDFLRAANETT